MLFELCRLQRRSSRALVMVSTFGGTGDDPRLSTGCDSHDRAGKQQRTKEDASEQVLSCEKKARVVKRQNEQRGRLGVGGG